MTSPFFFEKKAFLSDIHSYENMNSRELSIRALEFKKPERIPLFLSMTPWRSDIVGGMFFPNWGFKVPKGWPVLPRSPSSYIQQWIRKDAFYLMDEFGSIWYNPGNDTIGQVVNPRALSSWDKLKTMRMPKKIDKGRWWLTKFLFRTFGRNKYKLGTLDNFFYERMHFLRGFNNIVKDIKRQTEKVKELAEKLADWYCWLVDKWAALGAHGIIATDDWGTNHSPFISPRDFDEIFKPAYQTVTERIHDHGMHFMLHSCGQIYELIPSLIESGVDCLQLDTPRFVGLKRLAEFKGKMAYMCVAGIADIIPNRTPREVQAEVVRIIKHLGRFNGGLLGTIYADLQALNFPRENMEASVKAYRRFGRYDQYPLKKN